MAKAEKPGYFTEIGRETREFRVHIGASVVVLAGLVALGYVFVKCEELLPGKQALFKTLELIDDGVILLVFAAYATNTFLLIAMKIAKGLAKAWNRLNK